jgi:apolipoprotein N-acyltransferase
LRFLAKCRIWIAAAAGAALALAFAPYAAWPLAFISPALLFLLWEEATPREALRAGFAFGAALFAAGSWWLYIAIHDFGQAPVWLTVILVLAVFAIMGVYYALLGWLVTRFARDAPLLRLLLLLPAAWTLMEWARGLLLSGFPWLQLGYAHSDNWLAALAPVAGIHFVTYATALTAAVLVLLLRGAWRERAIAAGLALAIWGGAWSLDGRQWTAPAGEAFEIALLQGAIPQDEKWLVDNRMATLERFRGLHREALGARIIVWPESAIPMLAHEAAVYLEAIRQESFARDSDVMIGLLRYDYDTAEIRNGLYSMSAAGDGWYYKRRLVPFGEFFPVPAFVRRWMRLMSLPYYDMTRGEDTQAPLRSGGERLAATICYEDGYGSDQLDALTEATLLVNVTNNAWFGDSSAPHQQLQMARFRALEAGRWLMRATSNGITAVIGPDGEVTARAPQFVPAVLKSTVQPRTGLTPYARVGNWPVLSGCLLLCVAAIAMARRRPHVGRV